MGPANGGQGGCASVRSCRYSHGAFWASSQVLVYMGSERGLGVVTSK